MVSTGDCRLARQAQVIAGWNRQIFVWFSLAMAAMLAGCGMRGFSIEDAVPDRTLVTGTVAQPQNMPVDPDFASDEETIRNAVSSALVEQAGQGGDDSLGWANAGTGSRGTISQIVEQRDGPRICRRFTASRESFDGVHLYSGETCLGSSRIWMMTAFNRVE